MKRRAKQGSGKHRPVRTPARKARKGRRRGRTPIARTTAPTMFAREQEASVSYHRPVQRIDPETLHRLEQKVESLQQRHSASSSQREFWGVILKTFVITLPLAVLLALAAFTDLLNSFIGELIVILFLYFAALAVYFWMRNKAQQL